MIVILALGHRFALMTDSSNPQTAIHKKSMGKPTGKSQVTGKVSPTTQPPHSCQLLMHPSLTSPYLPCTLRHSLTFSYTLPNACHSFLHTASSIFSVPPMHPHGPLFSYTLSQILLHTSSPTLPCTLRRCPRSAPVTHLCTPSLTYVVPLTHFLAYPLQPSPIPSLASFPIQQQPLTCFQQESRSFLSASLQTSIVGRNLVVKKTAGSCFT